MELNVIPNEDWNGPLDAIFKTMNASKVLAEGLPKCWARIDDEIKSIESHSKNDFLRFVADDFVNSARKHFGDAETLYSLIPVIEYANLELWNLSPQTPATDELSPREKGILAKFAKKDHFKWVFDPETQDQMDHGCNDIRSLFQAHKIDLILTRTEGRLPAIVTIGSSHVDVIKKELEAVGHRVDVISLQELTKAGALNHFLSKEFNLDMCEYCKAPTAPNQLKQCSNCQEVRYCSKPCQKSDWGIHKKSCKERNLHQ